MNIKSFSTFRRHTSVLPVLAAAALLATLLVSPAVAARKAKAKPRAVNIKRSVKLGPWYTSVAVKCKLTKPEFAERGVDLKAKSAEGKALWKTMPELKDGVVHGLSLAGGCSQYFYRTITAKVDVTVTGGFGSDDGCAAWLNGKRILLVDVPRGVSADSDTASPSGR